MHRDERSRTAAGPGRAIPEGCNTDDDTPAVIAEAEARGAVVWPEHVPMPELRDLKFLPWEKARTMGFPFNVPNGADEEEG